MLKEVCPASRFVWDSGETNIIRTKTTTILAAWVRWVGDESMEGSGVGLREIHLPFDCSAIVEFS